MALIGSLGKTDHMIRHVINMHSRRIANNVGIRNGSLFFFLGVFLVLSCSCKPNFSCPVIPGLTFLHHGSSCQICKSLPIRVDTEDALYFPYNLFSFSTIQLWSLGVGRPTSSSCECKAIEAICH